MLNQDAKLSKIREITDEIGEFHPLLMDLLPKLPNITKVDYTHGQNEMGADFVITQYDQTLDAEEYIGLIAKCGNIAQNHDSLERQIKECSVSRVTDGGKKKIYLNQIWIVTTGGISENAKKKIYAEYSTKNIKFLWDERLLKLINMHFQDYWESLDKHVCIYLSSINRKAQEQIESQLLYAPSCNFYFEQEIQRIEPSSNKKFTLHSKNPITKLSAALSKERFILVQAEMGFGKSRLLRQAAIEYSDRSKVSTDGVLPVFLSFRDLLDTHKNSLVGILEHLSSSAKIAPEKYSLLFVIDSVDELKKDSKEKAEAITEFISQLMPHKNIRAIFASRPLDDPIANQILDRCLSRYSLLPLTIQRLISFVEKICDEKTVTSKLKRDLQKSDLFRSLPKSPISAILLGRVLKVETKELPSTLPELYSKYIELALGRWELSKGNGSEKEYETATILIRFIAKFMLENDLSEIGIGDAKSIIEEYLSKRQTGQSAESIFSYIINCKEVISSDEVHNKVFFKHRSFMEFMYAEYLHVMHGRNAHVAKPFDYFWATVHYFYLGKLKDCPEQLSKIFSTIPRDENEQWGKLLQGGSYLLAAYQSPYPEISNCLKTIILEACDMYDKICSKPKESYLGAFSEVQLLATMTGLMRHTFEYDFFEPALRDAEADVLLSADTDKRKALAAFFIAAIRGGLGKQDAFDCLITDHLTHIPVALRLGISHASTDADITSTALKKYEKQMQKSKGSRKALIKNIYDTPLNQRNDPPFSL